MPSNVLPLHLKQTFLSTIWIFTEGEGDQIKSRLPFKIFDENFGIHDNMQVNIIVCSQHAVYTWVAKLCWKSCNFAIFCGNALLVNFEGQSRTSLISCHSKYLHIFEVDIKKNVFPTFSCIIFSNLLTKYPN